VAERIRNASLASVMIAKEAAGSRVNTRQLRSSSFRTVFSSV
jgi:hypothetical protein